MSNPFVPTSFEAVERLADHVAQSRMFGITNPSVAVVLMGAAAALGFEPLQGLAGMKLVGGNPCPSADMLVAACLRSPSCERFVEIECSEDTCTWETSRNGVVARETFSMADAKRAGLVRGGSGWEKFPRKMLSARAKAALARRVYPDVCFGMYTPDELGSQDEDKPAVSAPVVRAFEDTVQRVSIQAATVVPALPVAATETAVEASDELAAISAATTKAEARDAAVALQKQGLDPAAIKAAYAKRIAELGQ